MPDLIIDNRPVTVPKGTKVIEAASQLGIMIPRFCYHEALGSVGACRLCAVKFLEGPVKGLDMSCQIEARDGMVISTTDKEAVEHRRWVIELLMMNHPHDCPVCDEGGHCLLQDETVSGGHVLRRFQGLKRTFRNQDLGVFVQHEMNRCIHCWRCRRFYQEYSGYTDLGVMQLGWRTYFGRFQDGQLENPFAGNLIDLCPTGVYTDKPSRFKGRRWDFERGPSLCIHCSLGCNTVASARYRELVRQEARVNPAVNGHFICDRGRYGFYYQQIPDRPREPMIGGNKATASEALEAAVDRFAALKGQGVVQCLGSSRASLETMTALTRLCDELGWPAPGFFVDPDAESKVRQVTRRLDERLAMSMADLEHADFILILGADLLNEAPMAALAVRQAWRNGAVVVSADPRPIDLPLDFVSLTCPPEELEEMLGRLSYLTVSRASDRQLSPEARAFLDRLQVPDQAARPWATALDDQVDRLSRSTRVAIICGTGPAGGNLADLAADSALLLREIGQQAGLFFTLPGANAFGAGLLSGPSVQGQDLLESIEEGRIKALLLAETDLFHECPDLARLEKAMEKLELLAIMDYLPSGSVRKADVFWPTTTLFEKTRSTFINQEGRLQVAEPICPGGLPISGLNNGDHPPREFRADIPGDEARPAGEILSRLCEKMGSQGFPVDFPEAGDWLAQRNLLPQGLDWGLAGREGVRILPQQVSDQDFNSFREAAAKSNPAPPDQYRLVWVDRFLGTEELSGYSAVIQAAEPEPFLYVSRQDANSLGLVPGDSVSLQLESGPVVLKVEIREPMASGFLAAPRQRRLHRHESPGSSVLISRDRIKKAN